MAKKQQAVEEQNAQPVDNKKQIEKNSKENKKQNKQNKKDKKRKDGNGGLGKKTKETMSELKKVTWPSFGEVVKKTGIVIAFVVLFGLFFYGINALLGWLATLLA